jgi:hypothetical protein
MIADWPAINRGTECTGEVVHGQLARARAPDDLLVRRPELDEVHRLGTLDRRDDELPGAVRLLEVDRQTEVDARGLANSGLAVLQLGVRPVHRRHGLDGLHDGVADEVGERDLAAAAALEVVVDDDSVVDEELGRDVSH